MNSIPAERQAPAARALRLTLLCLALNVLIVAGGTGYVHGGYSRVDTFTESLIRDAAQNYVRNGFLHDAGLPVISEGWIRNFFPQAATAHTEHVYLHYPCLAYVLAGISALLSGTDDIRYLRIAPMMVNSSLLFVFFTGVFSVLAGPVQRRWFLACFAAIPMGWAELNGFSPNIYAHYVLMALVGLLLPAFHAERPGPGRHLYAGAGVCGFLGGCFTWDYIFVMTLAPLAVASLFRGADVFRKGPLRALMLQLSVCVAAGFLLAQGLHLLQVAVYYGSLRDAFAELWSVAWYRATDDASRYHFLTGLTARRPCDYCAFISSLGPLRGRVVLVFDYLFVFTAVDFGGHPVLVAPVAVWLAAAALFVCVRGDKALKRRFFVMAAVTTASCLLWPLLMMNHGFEHTRLLARHFYFVYMLLALFIIVNIAGPHKKPASQPAAL